MFQYLLAGSRWWLIVPTRTHVCKWLIRPSPPHPPPPPPPHFYCRNISLIDIAEGIFMEMFLLEIKISSLIREKSLFFHTAFLLIFWEDWEFAERSNWVLRLLSFSVASSIKRSKLAFTPDVVGVMPWFEIKSKKAYLKIVIWFASLN